MKATYPICIIFIGLLSATSVRNAAAQEFSCPTKWEVNSQEHRLCKYTRESSTSNQGTILMLSGCGGFAGEGMFDSDRFGRGKFELQSRSGKLPNTKLVGAGTKIFYKSHAKAFAKMGYHVLQWHHVRAGETDCNGVVHERLRTMAKIARIVDSLVGNNKVYRSKLMKEQAEKLSGVLKFIYQNGPTEDRNKIHLVGWSLGASVIANYLANNVEQAKQRIQSTVMFYPSCPGLTKADQINKANVPILWFHGVADVVAKFHQCGKLIEAANSASSLIRLITFPQAHHAFDNVLLKGRPVEFELKIIGGRREVTVPIIFRYDPNGIKTMRQELDSWFASGSDRN